MSGILRSSVRGICRWKRIWSIGCAEKSALLQRWEYLPDLFFQPAGDFGQSIVVGGQDCFLNSALDHKLRQPRERVKDA